jgi:hypothetical protein
VYFCPRCTVCIAVAVQVADRLPNAPAVLVTAGDEGAAELYDNEF